MAEYTQATRQIEITTTLGTDVLLLRSAMVSERLSELFEIKLDLLSENQEISAASLLGKTATVRLSQRDESQRFFNGYINQFAQVGFDNRFAHYQATLVPWLWFLTRTSDCRIFQNKNVPDIIKAVFRENGFTDFDDRLSTKYPIIEYCVQYRETHFNFVNRLMENEGIYWFFKHENGKHTLVLADAYSAHQPCAGNANIPYHVTDKPTLRDSQDVIFSWSLSSAIRSGAFVHDDFNFIKPSAELLANKATSGKHPHADYEIYDYPGGYLEASDGKRYAGVRLEELQSEREIVTAEGYARNLAVGQLFTLTNHPRSDQNCEHLVTSAVHWLRTDEFQNADAENSVVYRARFTAIYAQDPFRPARKTPKPIVQGPQTAIVVGKSGEEIWTDKYGRVQVQFHWDRYGKKDENSSCWVRVSQPWAGQKWGAIAIPRIGQEVIVSFLEGDPDQPMITGRVYNAEQMPPWELPTNMTQSGIQSRSTKTGAAENANIIRLEDKKDSEEIYIHAEKDMNTIVENNSALKVGFEKKDKGNQTIDIYNNRTATLDQGHDSLTVKKGNRTTTINEGNDSLTLKKGNRTVTLDQGNETITLKKGNRTVTLDMGKHTLQLKKGDQNVQLDMGNCSVKIKMGNQETKLDLGKSTTEAMQSIELKVGQSSVKLDQTGVTIKGLMVKIEGQAQTKVTGAITQVEATGMLTLKGAITMIN